MLYSTHMVLTSAGAYWFPVLLYCHACSLAQEACNSRSVSAALSGARTFQMSFISLIQFLLQESMQAVLPA